MDLAALLAARGADPAPAFSPDGRTWLTAAELLGLARDRRTARRAPVASAVRAVPVVEAAPREALVALLGAQLVDATPVVLGPGARVDPVALAAAVAHDVRDRGLDPRQVLAVVTSGSSGRPRTVLRTTASWAASLTPFGRLVDDGGVAWAPGGLSSTLTLWAVWHALATGVPVVATGPLRPGTDPPGARVLHGVPAVVDRVLRGHVRSLDGGLRTAVVAGSSLPPGLRGLADAAGLRLVEYYGAAELSFVAADADGRGLRSVPGVEVRIRSGRVEARSPYLSLGYVGHAAGPLSVAADGWAGVGDRGRLAPDGVLTVRGRGEAAVDVGGHTVLVEDVEAVLAAVPGVAEAVCLALERGRLVAVLRPATAHVDGGTLVAAARHATAGALPRHARPLAYRVLEDLPRTAGGKVARGVLALSWGPSVRPGSMPVMTTALLLVDVQRDMLEGDDAAPDAERVRPVLDRLLATARAGRTTLVVHVQNDGPAGSPDEPGSRGWELLLDPVEGEPVVHKDQPDAFAAEPDLAPLLRSHRVERVVVAGLQSELCVQATARGALREGFAVEVVADGHATYDEGGVPAAEVSARVGRELADDGVRVVPADEVRLP